MLRQTVGWPALPRGWHIAQLRQSAAALRRWQQVAMGGVCTCATLLCWRPSRVLSMRPLRKGRRESSTAGVAPSSSLASCSLMHAHHGFDRGGHGGVAPAGRGGGPGAGRAVQRGACGRSNCRRLGKLTMTSSSSGAVGRRRSCGDRRDGRVRAASTMPAPGLQGMSVMWQGGHVRGASAVSAPVPVWRVRGGRRGSRQLL